MYIYFYALSTRPSTHHSKTFLDNHLRKGDQLEFGNTLFLLQNDDETIRQRLQVYNAHTAQLGLCLTADNVRDLIRRQREALNDSQRVEFGAGPLENIIKCFGDSPYLTQETYSETLGDLQEIFYQLKTSTENEISDDDLVDAMRVVFDNTTHGSTELFDELPPSIIAEALRSINTDEDEDWSEYDTMHKKESTVEDTAEPLTDNLARVKEAERFERATNEYAESFYDEQFELYRTKFDYNSRIGGSSL